MNRHYRQPVTIHFGNGTITRLKDEIRLTGKKRGILITSPSFEKNGLAARLVTDSDGTLVTTYSGISPNPDIRECNTCIKAIRENAGDYLDRKIPLPPDRLPLIAVPTTAGTGSEITRVAVLSDHEKGIKTPLDTPTFYPDIALIDPELTWTVPRHITACTGMDVLCHAIEAYRNIHHQPVCDALAIHAIRLVFRYLETACEEPSNPLAREKMAEASVTAGMAFSLPGTPPPTPVPAR